MLRLRRLSTRPVLVRPAAAGGSLRRARRALAGRLQVLGNLAFLVGSVLFLSEASQTAGVWLFIVGSVAFLLDGLRPAPKRE